MRKAVLGLALAVALTGVAAAAVRAPARAVQVVHARAATAAAGDVSSNWAGYVATGPGSTSTTASPAMQYTDVTGQWRQPAATCTPGQSASAALWVGLGGYSDNSQELEQAGTSSDCNAIGKASYYAWYELVPASSVTVKLKIFPGDVIASVVKVEGGEVLVQVIDRTRKTRFTRKLPMAQPDLTSAEWIVEAPALCGGIDGSRCRELALTKFGSVAFSRTFATGNGSGGTITSPDWMATAIQLVPDTHRRFGFDSPGGSDTSSAGASTSGLAADGSGFTISWQANSGSG